jgi:hypothetical protein
MWVISEGGCVPGDEELMASLVVVGVLSPQLWGGDNSGMRQVKESVP